MTLIFKRCDVDADKCPPAPQIGRLAKALGCKGPSGSSGRSHAMVKLEILEAWAKLPEEQSVIESRSVRDTEADS